MGQDKKQLKKLLTFVKDIYDNPDNKEFADGINAFVVSNLQSAYSHDGLSEQINEIHELCIRNILREQARDLYKSFPLKNISNELAELFVAMEDARRHNDFDVFGFNLYQQIELIVHTLINDTDDLSQLYNSIRVLKPFTKKEKDSGKLTRTEYKNNDNEVKTAEYLILIPKTEDNGSKTFNSYGKQLSALSALEKTRAVFYMVNMKCDVNIYKSYEIFSAYKTISSIYMVRNHCAHSGGAITDRKKELYDSLVQNTTVNYIHFLSFLISFIEDISANYSKIPALVAHFQ